MVALGSLWIGKVLGPIELASIASFLRTGHDLTLYSYGDIANLPPGVDLRDAAEIMPGDRILRHHRDQSPAIHSDLFRYRMIAATGRIWVDLDIIALRPFRFAGAHVFGYEHAASINNAVLGLPGDSPTLAGLLALRPETRGLPPRLTGLRKARYQLRNALAGGLPLDRWPWGSTGPALLTHLLHETGEIAHALPVQAFYAVPFADHGRFADPGGLAPDDVPPGAYGLHLWANALKKHIAARHGGRLPRDSFLAGLGVDAV